MRTWIWLIALLAASCVQSGSVACSDGTVCPSSFHCLPAGGCAAPDQLAACDGHADGDACTVAGRGAGVCRDGACAISACGNGIVELDEVCDDGNLVNGDGCSGNCRSDESCGNGVSELDEECDCGDAAHPGTASCAGTSNGGAQCSELCKRRFCGNGVVELAEICDDGNNTSGDGCSFDCMSNETCANNILDFAAGEECDDGNTRNDDGCASTCRSEALAWRLEDMAATPSPRFAPAMTYDAARGRIVMFGGSTSSGSPFGTWELDGARWTQIATNSPPPGSSDVMVYDSRRARIVMYGGGTALDPEDTFEYDGTTWTKVVTPAAPTPRVGQAMAYDAARGRVVVVGGTSDADYVTVNTDTWEYDGLTWILRTPTVAAPPRTSAALVYDPKRGRLVLFGGFADTSTGVTKDETWEYDGTTWQQRSPTNKPPGRVRASMVWDAARQRVVLFGGMDGSNRLADTWEYDGTNWSNPPPSQSPTIREGAGAAYDIAHRRMTIFGGFGVTPSSPPADFLGETWTYEGTSWTALPAAIAPPPRHDFAMAYDVARGRLVVFGGALEQTSLYDDTWEFDGSTWTEVMPTTRPAPRYGHSMVYDSARRRIVMYGGATSLDFNTPGEVDETWIFDGTDWTPAAAGPGGRTDFAMAYDAHRDRVVMFSGTHAQFPVPDTWEFDGSTWSSISLAALPPERRESAMVYDRARELVVLFGGLGSFSASQLHDTWEYDGSSWTQRETPTSPPDCYGHAMAYDAARQRSIVYGGRFRDTWEYDGTTWSQQLFTDEPPSLYQPGMVYDPARNRVVLFAGAIGNTDSAATWSLGFDQVAAGEACSWGIDADGDGKVGCADDECWPVCSPLCTPGATGCPASPKCGDGTCDSGESCRNCPADCAHGTAACPAACGDRFCEGAETVATCPGDCTP